MADAFITVFLVNFPKKTTAKGQLLIGVIPSSNYINYQGILGKAKGILINQVAPFGIIT